ncbi:MAG TPA: TadE family protein, partial [Terriglobales bacterium]|nr:TadE family protein [Terriglobales bacterium]
MSSAQQNRPRNAEDQFLFAHLHGPFSRFSLLEEEGAQIVEFAVALPLLIVFVVGIFDFSSAFTLKQKLTNVARDTARTIAAEPTS